jgi:hypothetical protein
MKYILLTFIVFSCFLTSCFDPYKSQCKIKYVIFYTQNHADTLEQVFDCVPDFKPEVSAYKGVNFIIGIKQNVESTAPIKIISIEKIN